MPIASEWRHRARIHRGEHLAGALIALAPASRPGSRLCRGQGIPIPSPPGIKPQPFEKVGGPARHPRRLDEATFSGLRFEGELGTKGCLVSTVQKWETGDKKPSGPSLKLLNLIDRKGLEAVI